MSKKLITALSAGLTLAVAGGCGPKSDGPTENPPAPEPVKPQPPTNPPPPDTLEVPTPPPLPTWEQAVNPTNPDGTPDAPRTNPPVPALRTDADGRCYVVWYGARRGPPTGPYDPVAEGGAEIQCPPDKTE
ncbi:MAG: hypothetical protein VX899_14670 [Myxococcota bacterium]|nr:hypothetical protein [Myxococcota bacterium]